MNFIEKIANYCLGNLQRNHFPEIAMTALNEGIESESLYILAGMNDMDNTFELQQYFDNCLNELGLTLPDKYTSAQLLLNYYLNKMIIEPDTAYKTMSIIDNQITKQVDWEKELELTDKKYVGEELGLEKIYTWYRELQDFEDGSMLLYFNELPRQEQKEKFEIYMIEEAKNVKDKIDKEITTHNNKYRSFGGSC
ncbi:MAG: hypothetical protein JXA53_10215 [Bacteroidales bacterium]|nr:hypothetical protein [Bacteroidales bacterium]